jgi:protein-disulfide isomerase
MPAAEAAMAANAQGKFWEMHDKLFGNQQTLDRAHYEQFAQEIGLNVEKFKADLDGHKYKDRIDKDSAEGTKAGASGTPTFFINGYKLVGAQPVDAFKKLIDQELKKKGVK